MTFRILTPDNPGGGRVLGDKSRDLGRIHTREIAVGAEIPRGTREPNETASGIENEWDCLRRRAEAERDGVTAVAFSRKRRFHDGGGSCGGGGESIFVGFNRSAMFKLMSSSDGGISKTAE